MSVLLKSTFSLQKHFCELCLGRRLWLSRGKCPACQFLDTPTAVQADVPTVVSHRGVYMSDRLFVLLQDISTTNAAKLDTVHHESWKSTYSGFKRSKVNGQGHESQKHSRRGSLHSCECWFLLVVLV